MDPTPSRRTSVRLTAQIRYDATPDQVFAMLTDRGFQELKCARTGALSYRVEIGTLGAEVSVTSDRELPTDTIPDFVRSFVGDTVTVRQQERWNPAGARGARTGTLSVEIVSTPVRFTGAIRLAAADTGRSTVESFEGELKAAVPLIGGRIEKATEPAIRAAIEVEQRTGTAWLAEHAG
jgi:hypothetical protein